MAEVVEGLFKCRGGWNYSPNPLFQTAVSLNLPEELLFHRW